MHKCLERGSPSHSLAVVNFFYMFKSKELILIKRIILLLLTLSSIFSSYVYSDSSNYEQDLAGIWAMKPVIWPIKGAANVIKYNYDGTYYLYGFKCSGDGKFFRDKSQDSEGSWRIEGNDIVTTTENFEELERLSDLADEMRVKLDSLNPEQRKLFRSSLPQSVIDLIDNNFSEGRQTILALSSSTMKSKQELGFGKFVYFDKLKVNAINPLCDDF